jgi:hypothetical protein
MRLSAGERSHDEQVMRVNRRPVAALRRQRHAVGAGGPVFADPKLQRGFPAAAQDRALLGRVLPTRTDNCALQHRCGARAVTQYREPIAIEARTHLQAHRVAGRIRKSVGVAPDLAARAVHAGMLVAMPENGFATLLWSQTEIRNIDGHLFFVTILPDDDRGQ